jgi:hypothetical protein
MSTQRLNRPKELSWFAGLSYSSLAIGFAATLVANAMFNGHTRPLSDGLMPLTVMVTVLAAWLIWRAFARRSKHARTALAVIACAIVPQGLLGMPAVFANSPVIGLASTSALVMQAAGVLMAFRPAANAWFAEAGGKS